MVRWAIQAFLLACSVLSKRKIEQSWAEGECRDRLGLSMTLNGQFQPRSMPAQFAYIYTVSFAQKKTYTLFQPGSQPISRSAPEWIFNEARWSCMDFIACWHKTLKKRSSCDLVSSWSDQPSEFFFYVLPLNAYVLKNIMSVYIFLFSFWWLVQAFSCNCKASAMNTTKDLLEYDVSDRETFVVSNMPTYVLQNLPSQWKEPLHKIKNSSYTDKNGGFHFPPHFLASHSSIQDDEWVLLSLLYQALAHCIEENGQLSPNKYTKKK